MSDLCRGSDAALETGARIARRSGADLHVVHAMGLHGISLREALGLLHESQVKQTQDSLENQLERALPEGVRPATYGLDYQDARLAVRAPSAGVAAPRRSLVAGEGRSDEFRLALCCRGGLTGRSAATIGMKSCTSETRACLRN